MLDTAIFIVEVVVFVAASLHLVYRLFLSPPAPSPSPQISDAPAMDRDVREAARTAGGGRHTKTGVALADAAPVDVSAMGFSAEEVVRTRLEAVLELAGVADCNALPSATSNVSLALEDVLLTELPALPALAHLRQLSLRVDPPEMPLPGLSLLTHVSRLKLSGPALQAETLRAVGALPELQVSGDSGCSVEEYTRRDEGAGWLLVSGRCERVRWQEERNRNKKRGEKEDE